MPTVMAATAWPTNADLIADCAALGYLREEWLTLDCTYGLGNFWKKWRPERLVGTDLNPAKSQSGRSVDFRNLPFSSRMFDAVVFDPPYKLNGTPDAAVDEPYGVDTPTRWQDRMRLIYDGTVECAHVLGNGFLLVKCQDQVCSGKVRWQSRLVTDAAEAVGLGLVDRFDMLGHYRPQPEGRRQVHAARNSSSLLVFKRGWCSK